MDENKRTVTANPAPGQNPQSQKRRHVWWWVLGLLVLLLVVIAFLTHRHSAAQAGSGRGGANGPITVGTVTAQKGNMNVYVEALGTVTPVYTVSVAARVAGQI